MNVRKRRISGQLRAPELLAFDTKRTVALGKSRIELEVDSRATGLSVVFADGYRAYVEFGLEAGRPAVGRERRRRFDRGQDARNPERLSSLARGRRRRRARLHPPRG